MTIEIQIAIRDALAAGGEMKAVAEKFGVSFAAVRKAANDGWPDIPTLPHTEDSGDSNPGEPTASAPRTLSPSTATVAAVAASTTMEKLEAIMAELNPKLQLRITTRIIHLHLLRAVSKSELKIVELRAAGQLAKELLYIEQNTGAAKESDIELIDALMAMAESGDPKDFLNLYAAMLTANQGVTNPDIVATDEPNQEAQA